MGSSILDFETVMPQNMLDTVNICMPINSMDGFWKSLNRIFANNQKANLVYLGP